MASREPSRQKIELGPGGLSTSHDALSCDAAVEILLRLSAPHSTMLSAFHLNVVKGCVRAVLVHETFDHVFFSDRRTYRSDAGKCALPKFSKALFILLCMNIARKFFLFQRNLRAHLLLALRPMLRCTMRVTSLPFPFLSFFLA